MINFSVRKYSFFTSTIVLSAALLVGCSDDGNNTTSSSSSSSSSASSASSSSSSSGGDAVMPISAARALENGKWATVEGYVTVAPGTFNSATGDQGFVIQDATGGIYVGMTELLTFPLNQKVRVSGTTSQVAQLSVLAATKEGVSEVAGMTMTIMPKDAKTGDVNEVVESNLIRVAGKVTKMVVDDSPYGMKVFVDDGTAETQVFVHLVAGKPVIDTSMLAIDQMITVVGVGAQYETTYEVCPRKAEDLTK